MRSGESLKSYINYFQSQALVYNCNGNITVLHSSVGKVLNIGYQNRIEWGFFISDIGYRERYRGYAFILDAIYNEILIIKSWSRVIQIIYLIKMM